MKDKLFEVMMPQLGVNDEKATIIEWSREKGEAVKQGQVLAIIETTKASFELECEIDGYFFPLVEAGAEASVREVIALITPVRDEDLVIAYRESKETSSSEAKDVLSETITVGARRLIEQHVIDRNRLPKGRIIRESDVRALLEKETGKEPGKPSEKTAFSKPVSIVVYGASEGGDCVVEILKDIGDYEIAAYLDDDPEQFGTIRKGIPVRPGTDLEKLGKEGIVALATHIADARVRLSLLERVRKAGLFMPAIIHPQAFLASNVIVGEGNLIKAGAVIDAATRLGDCCIIDNGAIIPHNTVIGNGCHIAPGVRMGGGCRIGDGAIIGIGAVLSARLSIGSNVIVGVGAVVTRDVPDKAILESGNAKIIGERRLLS